VTTDPSVVSPLISLLHPTRERAQLCLETTRAWSASVEQSGIAIEHLVAIDEHDRTAYEEYVKLADKERWCGGGHRVVFVDGIRLEIKNDGSIWDMPPDDALDFYLTAVNKVNHLATLAKGRWLFFIADDFWPTSDQWLPALKLICEQWRPEEELLVVSPERDGRALINHPIISRAFYEHQGWFFCPEYMHVCVDADLFLSATLQKSLRFLPAELCSAFMHRNPYLKTETKWDKVYSIGNHTALYDQGARVFEKRKKLLLEKYGSVAQTSGLLTPVVASTSQDAGATVPTPTAHTPRPAVHSPKILILYAFYETPDAVRNLEFFARHGITPHRDRTHIIIVNGTCSIEDQLPKFENVTVIKRDNRGFDFGAWAHALGTVDVEQFDYFFFVNSSTTGPFMPTYQDASRWPDVFVALLNERVKLAGITINVLGGEPHVQSMFMATDRVGLKLLSDGGIFKNNEDDATKEAVILARELRSSKIILDAGFDIDCLSEMHRHRSLPDLRRDTAGDTFFAGRHIMGHTLEPHDTIFFKTNRGCSADPLRRAMNMAEHKRSTAASRCFQDRRVLGALDILKGITSAWLGHVDLAVWLTYRFSPQIVVDLGVDYGVSTYAWGVSGMSQVIGIDWFQGDVHAGIRDTYVEVVALGNRMAESLDMGRSVRIWKSSFDEAAASFDRKADIIHLDGLHTYEAVQQDLRAWLPKLAKGGLLIMHDIRAFPDSVGRIFDGLPQHKIAFDHSAGLGIVSTDREKIAIIDREWKQQLYPSTNYIAHRNFDRLRIHP